MGIVARRPIKNVSRRQNRTAQNPFKGKIVKKRFRDLM